MWSALVSACCFAAVFGPTADNPWDQLRDAFYVRQLPRGGTYQHEAALDGPPTEWYRLYDDERLYQSVLEKLDAFLALPPEQVEQAAPIRRAILLRDMWPVFDVQLAKDLAVSENAAGRRVEIRTRLAKIMRRLELTEAEAAGLPDNYHAAVTKSLFAASWDESAPERGFLPPDLLDPAGPWVPVGNPAQKGRVVPAASEHLKHSRVRSIFVPLVHASDDREETIAFLQRRGKSSEETPTGALLALVRRMVLPASSGRIVATPVVESVQFLVVAKGPIVSVAHLGNRPRDVNFKFVLDRAKLLAGEPGLRMLTDADPVDIMGLEAHKIPLVGWEDAIRRRSLDMCFLCHHVSSKYALFPGPSDGEKALTTWDDQVERILIRHEKDPRWKTYLEMRN